MKVYVLVVDTRTGIYQSGMIDEPVKEGLEIDNALKHFGIEYCTVEWVSDVNFDTLLESNPSKSMCGYVNDTNKLVNVIAY